MQNVGNEANVEKIQRCFCMDIKRSEKDPTKVDTTQN
jgi:hypothetical protein